MNRPNITEGEWKVNGQEIIGNERNGYICTWSGRKANAKAISAVPEMIDALIKSHSVISIAGNGMIFQEDLEQSLLEIESALKKAGCHE